MIHCLHAVVISSFCITKVASNDLVPNRVLNYHLRDSSNVVTTSFEGESGSFGNMWDVWALGSDDITVVDLDFHTEKNNSEVFYEIYTNDMGYKGYESDMRNWKLVGSGSVVGKGKGLPTPIDRSTFLPVTVKAGSRKGFYFTLSSYELRYSPGRREGEFIVTDSFLGVTVGTGVAEYKFGETFFRPRVWNGNIYYSVNQRNRDFDDIVGSAHFIEETLFPTETITYLPTVRQSLHTSPTLKSRRTCTIKYPSTVEYPDLSFDEIDFQLNIRSWISYKLKERMSKIHNVVYHHHGNINNNSFFDNISTDNNNYGHQHDVAKIAVMGDISKSYGRAYISRVETLLSPAIASDYTFMCKSIGKSKCVSLEVIILVTYEGMIEEEDVRYTLLQFSSDIMKEIGHYGSLINVKYNGALPFETNTIFSVKANGLATINTREEANFFQDSVKSFLNTVLRKTSLKFYGVQLETQRVDKPLLRVDDVPTNGRSRQYSVIELTAVITGEYTPPPFVDVALIIDESINENGVHLIDDLKQIFEKLVEVKTRSTFTVGVPTPSPTIGIHFNGDEDIIFEDHHSRQKHSKVQFINLFTVAVAITIFAFVMAIMTLLWFIYNRFKERNKSLLTNNDIKRVEDIMFKDDITIQRRGSTASTIPLGAIPNV